MSACVEEKVMINSNDDEASYKEFYNAIRSGNIKQLDGLINKWSGNEFDVNIRELDETLSRAYEELKLKNVKLSEVTEIFVENKLINLRFISNSSTKNKNEDRLGNIEKRIELVLETINQLNTEYSGVKKVDEKFLFVAKFIAQNIHILKQQLRITYGKLPWEEMEFCLIGFVSSHIKQNEINLFYHSIFDKSKILKHLQDFKNVLKEVKEILKDYGFTKLVDLPKQTRERVATGIIEQYPQFEELYEDHQVIRDIYSLQKIQDYVNLVISADANEREGQLIVTRVLHLIGEYFKNTLESPNLSNDTSELLVLSLPKNTRNIVIDLRNSLCHAYSLFKRTKIEENTDVNFFTGVQNDTKNINEVINDILQRNKIKIIQSLLKKFVESEYKEEIKQVAQIFSEFELDKKIEEGFDRMMEHDKLEKLIKELQENITNQTNYEKQWFHEMNDVIMNAKSKSENNRSNYNDRVILSHSLGTVLKFYDFDNSSIEEAKYFAGQFLKTCTSTIESEDLTKISKLAMEISRSAVVRLGDDKCDTINKLAFEICFNVEFGKRDVKWTGRLRDKLNSRGSFQTVNKPQQRTYSKEKYNKLLELKLAELKSILKKITLGWEEMDKNIPFYRKNKKLLAVVEMLVLDIISVIGCSKKCLINNLLFLDEHTPLLTGKCLRDYLAHDNALVDIFLTDPSIAVFLNAEKLISENVVNTKTKFGKLIKEDPSKLKEKFERNVAIITSQEKMFAALEEGNLMELKNAVEEGADIYGRSMNSRTALHLAAQGPSLEVVKYVINQNVKVNTKDVKCQSPLHIAAAFGRENIVAYLVKEKNANVDELDNNRKTPMHMAAENGYKQTVRILMKNNANPYQEDKFGFSPLNCAITNNHIDVIQMMLQDGVNIQINDVLERFTSLHVASEMGHLEVVNLLLKNGAKVDAKNEKGGMPLHSAALKGHLEIVNALILHGSDINTKMTEGCTPLHYAVENGHEKVVEVLLKHGANVNAMDTVFNNTPLHYAAMDGHVGIVQNLLKNKANANIATKMRLTPLHFAAGGGHLGVVAVLLEHGTKIHAVDGKNATSLHYASIAGHREVVELLIKNGANVNHMTDIGRTPLQEAILRGHKDVVELLLSNKAEVRIKDHMGYTPLHSAGLNGNADIIDLLIDREAQIDAKANDCLTPLHEATRWGRKDAVDLLIKRGASVNAKTNFGPTPLHTAVIGNHKDIVSLLIQHKAEVDAKGIEGSTPLYLATEAGFKEIVDILISNGANVNVSCNNVAPLVKATTGNHKEIVKTLVEKGADVDLQNYNPLELAVLMGHADIVEILLKSGANLEKRTSSGESLLHIAACMGWKGIGKTLIRFGASVNWTNNKRETPLFAATQHGHEEFVEVLINNDAIVNASNIEDSIPLHVAVRYGHGNIVKILLKNDTVVDRKDDQYCALLEIAVALGHLQVVEIILQHKKVDVNAKNDKGLTILHIATQKENEGMVQLLVKEGCDVNVENRVGSKPIHIAAKEGFKDKVEFFLNQGVNVIEPDTGNNTPLHFAAAANRLSVLKYLVEQGADLNAKNSNGYTPLHVAAYLGEKEGVNFLLESGAVFKERDKYGKTPLDIGKDLEVLNLLKSTHDLFKAVYGNRPLEVQNYIRLASLNAKNERDETILHYPVSKGYEKVVEILLQNKANPNATCKGHTPLFYAVNFSKLKIAKALLSHGAKYNAVSSDGKIPLNFVKDSDAQSLLKFIDASFTKVEKGDETVVNDLYSITDVDTLKAVMRCCNNEGRTLVVVAVRNNFPKVNQLKAVGQTEIEQEGKLAILYIKEGYFTKSLVSFEKIYRLREEILGTDNPGTLDIRFHIAGIWNELGKIIEARSMLREVFQKQQEMLGAYYHADTIDTLLRIAAIWAESEKYEEALNIYQEIYKKLKEILGPNHVHSLVSLRCVALVLSSQGRCDEALIMMEVIFKKVKEILGEDNPVTLMIQNEIAWILSHQNKFEESLAIYNMSLELERKKNNLEFDHILRTLKYMFALFLNENRNQEALKTLEEILDIQKQIFSEMSPEKFKTLNEIGNVLFTQGKWDRAYKVYAESYEPRKMVLGANHAHISDTSQKMKIINSILKIHDEKPVEDTNQLQTDNTVHAGSSGMQNLKSTSKHRGDDFSEKMIVTSNRSNDPFFNTIIKDMAAMGGDVSKLPDLGDIVMPGVFRIMPDMGPIILQLCGIIIDENYVEIDTSCHYTKVLHIAVTTNASLKYIKFLLVKGAVYNAENVEGKIPFDFAINKEVANFLKMINDVFEDIKNDKVEVIQNLYSLTPVDFLAVANCRNKEGDTLLQIACDNKQNVIANHLVDKMKRVQQLLINHYK